MNLEAYLTRHAVTRSNDMTYELEFLVTEKPAIGHARRIPQVTGRIHYLNPRGARVGLMTWGDPFTVRASWHRLCRINRARVAGRPYLHLINVMGDWERKVLGHPPAGLRR
jgi:hypothetical protein